jgi:hypothetical protein
MNCTPVVSSGHRGWRFHNQMRQILRDGYASAYVMVAEECLEGHRRGDAALRDHRRGDGKNAPMNLLREIVRLQISGHGVEDAVVAEQRAEKALFQLEVGRAGTSGLFRPIVREWNRVSHGAAPLTW